MKKIITNSLSFICALLFISLTAPIAKGACNWKARNAATYFWDSCNTSANKYSLQAYISFKSGASCNTYQWTVNGKSAGTSNIMKYAITANGTYNICVKVVDSCNNCDTTYCATRTITCVKNTCNWYYRYYKIILSDSCAGKGFPYSVNGYIGFNYSKMGCFKYQWTVNGTNASTSRLLNYNVTANGTYKISLKVTDTCNNCDTTFLSTRTITCVKTKCNWKNNSAKHYYWDSCDNKKNRYFLNGYCNFYAKACFKYQWTVNGNKAGNAYTFKYPITANGAYTVCVKVTDTCNNCDTTYCTTRAITCVNTSKSCNWKSRTPANGYWDSCAGKKNKYSLNAYVYFTNWPYRSCLKYQWMVDSIKAGNTNTLFYPIKANGTYRVCVKVTDTCNNCDTTYCTTRTVTCVTTSSGCNWKSRSPYFSAWDSCSGKKNKYSVNGYVGFNYSKAGCFQYKWLVNNTVVSTSRMLNYPITKNGTYVVCMKVTDTCSKCDTTFCSTRTITCVSGSTCNWKNRKPYFSTWDSCNTKTKKYSVNGYVYFGSTNTSCYKYQWTVNGKTVSNTRMLNYSVTTNGYYVVCMKVLDSCNNCDTTFCVTRYISCIGTSTKCNWKSRTPANGYWDSCSGKKNKYSLNAYVYFTNWPYKSCFKYQWTVNGVKAGFSPTMNYPITANGTYNICVKVTDSCNNCDTTYCTTRTITCVNTSGCNWKSRAPYFSTWDSCTGKLNKYSVNGYVGFNYSKNTCFKYQWTVNGTKVSNARMFNYPITKNGTYVVCMKVTDTCNNCDTTFCSTRNITCVNTGCNWKNRSPYFITKDTCIMNIKNYSVNGYISLKGTQSCYSYQWSVNGSNVGTNYYMNYAVSKNGTYRICVKVSDSCNKCDTTFCNYLKVYCVPSGISKVGLNSEMLKVYPNPTNGIVTLELSIGASNYILTNSTGQIIQTGVLEHGINSVDLSKFPSGLYLIQVRTQDAILTKKLSIEKR